MKFVTCIIVALLFSCTTNAQNSASELITTLNSAKSDSARVNAYGDIFLYYEYSNPDSAVYFLEQGLKHFTEAKFKLGIARMMALLANEDMAQGRVELSKRRNEEALKIYTEIDYKDGIAFVNNNIGTQEGRTGNYDEATRHFMVALKAFESNNNKRGIQATYLKLGVVNERTNNIDKAIDYYNKSMELARSNGDSADVALLYNNIGIVNGKQGKFKEAMECFEKALQQSNSPKMVGVYVSSLMNMGIVYDNMGNKSKALENYTAALNIAKEKNLPEDYARVTMNMAALIDKTEPARALALLQSALDTVRRIGERSMQAEILDGMISIAKDQGNYKEAFLLAEQYSNLKDSIFNIQKAREIANLQSVYELDKSNAKVQELTISEHKNAQKRNVIIVIACTLAFLLAALTFFYRKSKRLNIQLSKREYELRKANTVKDKLFSIIGHDLRGPIANAPQMINIFRHPSTSDEEKTYLLDSLMENSTASIDTLDKLLYWGQSQIKGIGIKREVFNAYDSVQGTLRFIKSIADQKQINIVNKLPANVSVYADPTHVDFIVRNLLSNAIKFTYNRGVIEIKADKNIKPGYVVFSVVDSGIGMDKEQLARVFEPFGESVLGTANERGTSIGLMLCREFVKENGGEIWAESEEDKGSVFYFSLVASA